jgi:hypothetical protein
VFLLTPNPRVRDAVWIAPADRSSLGKKVFSGMQVTFPQRAPSDARISCWATFHPSFRSWSSTLLEFLAVIARFDALHGKTSTIDLNRLRVMPGDPAVVFNPESGKIEWMAIDASEQIQVGHYYQLQGDYETAWQWYEKANQAGKPKVVRESLFFQYRCLSKLRRDADANEKLAQFEREFWPTLPKGAKGDRDEGPGAAEFVLTLADAKSPHGAMMRDLYVAEVFLSLDAADDGEVYFRDGLKNASTDSERLNKAAVLSQFLLLKKEHEAYLQLVNTTLLPLLVSQDAFASATGENAGSPISQLSYFTGRQLAVLPFCDPEFVKLLDPRQVRDSLARLEELRKIAMNNRQRLWLDIMIHTAYGRLGPANDAVAAGKRIAENPERLDAQHGKNAVALIEELRRSVLQMEAVRARLQAPQ